MTENMTPDSARVGTENPQENAAGQHDIGPRGLAKAVAGVTFGNMVEWFDFAIYSSMSGVMAQVFFPVSNKLSQLIAVYAAFAAGFLIRPLGGFLFGPIGDKYGRRTALVASIALMSIATFCISAIPGYRSIGVWAPVLLVGMRLLQGLSTGGEYGGSCIFIAEYSPDKKRTFLTSWLEFGNTTGFLIGGLMVSGVTYCLGWEAMLQWGWRVPFLLASMMGVIALYIRMNVDETPVFRHMQEEKSHKPTRQNPMWDIFKGEWPNLLRSAGLVATFNVTYYIVLGYTPTYLANIAGYSQTFCSNLSLAISLCLLVFIPVFGWMGDYISRKTMLLAGCLFIGGGALPAFLAFQAHSSVLVISACMAVLITGMLCFHGTMPATLPSLFGSAVRYTCLAVSYNVSASLLGGTAPLVNTWLIARTQDALVPAWYLVVCAVIGLMALWGLKDRTGQPMPA
ncbi:MFS transporter [Acetobacter sp. TBRC 12305]|uniref:MFS transporter n=1 Tax=Acetobacter garciniae TaxID=2817435 RepID=A0A939HMA3_9PROT|nr:MFS transporter [Acetobacter garciniae]MBO1325485.1 MFS transporter [Acetobacter garciniae]MBX0345343.1 MFS transporter [Acetobacter garciniae]